DYHVSTNISSELTGNTLLYYAVKQNSDMVKIVLNTCENTTQLNINRKNKQSRTPLLCAADLNDVDIVLLLLQHGANIHDKNLLHHTPLIIALFNNNMALTTLLLEHQANVNDVTQDGWSALCIATYYSTATMVQLLLQYNANKHYHLTQDSEIDSR